MNTFNTINNFTTEEAIFTTKLITNYKKSEEPTLFTSSKVANNKINKISNIEILI